MALLRVYRKANGGDPNFRWAFEGSGAAAGISGISQTWLGALTMGLRMVKARLGKG